MHIFFRGRLQWVCKQGFDDHNPGFYFGYNEPAFKTMMRTDDQHNRQYKLEYHQSFSEEGSAGTEFQCAFQNSTGLNDERNKAG